MLPNTQVYLGVSRLSFSPFVSLLQFVFYYLLRALDAFSHTGISSSLSVSVNTQRIGRICRERQHSLRKMEMSFAANKLSRGVCNGISKSQLVLAVIIKQGNNQFAHYLKYIR